MIGRIFVRWGVLAALAVLSACANNSACTAAPIALALPPSPLMVSPAPGATGLPTSGFSVQIAYGSGGANHETLRLVDQNQQTLQGPAFAPIVPPPSPPPNGPAANEQAAVPQLAPHTTYRVFVDGASPTFKPNCASGTYGGPFSIDEGTFTTQ